VLPPKTPLANAYYRLLKRLWRLGPAPVPQLFKDLDLSRTLGDKLIDQMAQEGVAGLGTATGRLRLLDSYGTVLGLHMGTQTVNVAVVNFVGELLLSRDFPYPGRETPLDQAILQIVKCMEPFLRPPIPPLRGVAVSLPGIVDPYRLILLESKPLRLLQPVPLKETLGRSLGRPITVENDANCCCWGEAVVHRSRNLGNFLFLLAERRPYSAGETPVIPAFSIGSGLYLNGSVYHGTRFSAGEFQSILKEGNLQRNQFSVTDEEMDQSLDDPRIEERIARELSRNAALLVNTLNLDKVFVSWPREERIGRVVEILQDEIQQNWSYDHPVGCTVELPTMGRLAPAYGAAGLHLESLFQTADGPAPYFPGKN